MIDHAMTDHAPSKLGSVSPRGAPGGGVVSHGVGRARRLLAAAGRLLYRAIVKVVPDAAAAFLRDNVTTMAAAVAFYSLLSAGPLLLIVLAVTDTVWGREAAAGEIVAQLQGYLGPQATDALLGAVASSRIPGELGIASAISATVLLLSATLLLAQVRESLLVIWRVPTREGAIRSYLRQRLVALLTIAVVAFLLPVSTFASSVVGILEDRITRVMPNVARVWFAADAFVWWAWFTVLILVLFRTLAGRALRLRALCGGAAVAALLLMLGEKGLVWYVSEASAVSAYGAAGTVVTIALWVYYSAMALLYGAEFARSWELSRAAPASQPADSAAPGPP